MSSGTTVNNKFCHLCYKRDLPLKVCSGCLAVRYCGSEHQKADWKSHKTMCAGFRREREMDEAATPSQPSAYTGPPLSEKEITTKIFEAIRVKFLSGELKRSGSKSFYKAVKGIHLAHEELHRQGVTNPQGGIKPEVENAVRAALAKVASHPRLHLLRPPRGTPVTGRRSTEWTTVRGMGR